MIIVNLHNGQGETFTLTVSDFFTVDMNCGSVLQNMNRLCSPLEVMVSIAKYE